MAGILYKWLSISAVTFFLNVFTAPTAHPYFVSVTEIEYNAKDKSLEVSCKIFTDDFEKALRQTYKADVDLLKPKDKAAMNKLVNDYVTKHLQIAANGKATTLQFLGYEQQEEGIISFYEVKNISAVSKLDITDNILYEYKDKQIGIIHTIVEGNRKSTRLDNPKDKVSFEF
jgi:hypothetical protein